MVTEDRSRGQIILIGAIALAFIILGVVVVFNGVLYTETLTSADTGQSASTAETTELEIRHGIGCLLAEGDAVNRFSTTDNIAKEIEAFNEIYKTGKAQSRPEAVHIEIEEDLDSTDVSNIINNGIDISISYDSDDLSYEQTRTIEASDCPTDP